MTKKESNPPPPPGVNPPTPPPGPPSPGPIPLPEWDPNVERICPGNMDLWDQVCESELEYVKDVKLRGGFTTIAAYSQIMKATELWGPYGRFWGVKDLKYEYIGTSQLHTDKEDSSVPTAISLDATFFCPASSFPVSVDLPYGASDDCRKKLLTKCITKALSYLGFNADVFLGKLDNGDYRKQLKNKQQNTPKTSQEPARNQNSGSERVKTGADVSNAIKAIAKEKIGDYYDVNQFLLAVVNDRYHLDTLQLPADKAEDLLKYLQFTAGKELMTHVSPI